MKFEDIYPIVNKIPVEGWMTESDCHVIYDCASLIKKGEILEIGAYAGRSGLMLTYSSPTSKITSVDNCSEKTETNATLESVGWNYVKGKPTEILNKLVSEHDNWDLIVGDSQDVAKKWKKKLDLLLIDGAHDYLQCKKDIISWTPFLKSGHYLLMHDVTHILDVKRACNEMLSKYEWIEKWPYMDKYGPTQWRVYIKP